MPSDQPHLLFVGNRIQLVSTTPSFNGIFEITGTQKERFTFTAPGADNSGTVTSIRKLLGIEKVLIHDNTIELIAASLDTPPVGILLDDVNDSDPPPHGRVIIRNNRFRYVDGVSGSFNGYAVEVNGAQAVIIADNIVETFPTGADTIKIARWGAVTISDNRVTDREFLSPDTDRQQQLFELPAEDALVSACFAK